MAKDGTLVEPQPGEGAENPEIDATALDASVDADAAFKSATGNQKPEVSEDLTEEEPELESEEEPELDEDGNPVEPEEEAEDDEELDDKHKEVFSDQAFKIFKSRMGKEKAKREKLKTELDTATAANEQLKKESDPNVLAAAAEGIDSRFIETADAKVLAESAKVERHIGWLERISEDPEGYEDANGNSWTQAQVLAELGKATRNKESRTLMTKAEGIREGALTRQKEVIEAGIKALADQKKLKAALKKKPVKKNPTAAPGSKSTASTLTEPAVAAGNLSRALKKEGNTAEALARNF